MKDVKPQTANEDKMLRAIQHQIGAYENGIIGCQTMSDIAERLGADCFPVTLKLYGHPTIIAKDIIPFAPAEPLSRYRNALSGSFSFNKKPCSILVYGANVACGSACHSWLNKPESVLYKTNKVDIKRCVYSSDLPYKVKWAVGGMGLLDFYNPAEEGFSGSYADVLRKTNHTVLGEKNGYIYLIYFANMTAEQINAELKSKKICDKAILLDGGHVAAINGTESFAQINTNQLQYFAIQAI